MNPSEAYYALLDNAEHPAEDRLELAIAMLRKRDQYIQRLQDQIDKDETTREWIADQAGNKRMGL